MEQISAIICTYNEVKRIPKLIKSLKGVDEIILADDGSTDGTVKLAESLGAKVITRKKHVEIPTKDDYINFVKRFDWAPKFDDKTKINNGSACRMEALTYAKNDWVFMPDADEIVTWDLPEITKLLPTANQITCDFVHSHKKDGSPDNVSKITKLFRRSVSRIEARVHDVLLPTDKMIYTDKMRIDHYQKERTRTEVLPILEYSVIKDNDSRSRFYLGREYYYYKQYKKALTLFDDYLKDAKWLPEIAQARLYKAQSHWNSMEGDKAREECLEAIKLNPDFTEALNLMSEMLFEPWKSKWKFIAKNSTNKDVLF